MEPFSIVYLGVLSWKRIKNTCKSLQWLRNFSPNVLKLYFLINEAVWAKVDLFPVEMHLPFTHSPTLHFRISRRSSSPHIDVATVLNVYMNQQKRCCDRSGALPKACTPGLDITGHTCVILMDKFHMNCPSKNVKCSLPTLSKNGCDPFSRT